MINTTPQKTNMTHKKKSLVIGFQTSSATVKKIDRLAKAQGISRSDVLRIIVERHFQNGAVPAILG